MWFFPVVLLGVVALAAIAAALYNRLVRLRNTVGSSWSDVGVLLKKRYDLVDNLVETVKGYATHEKSTLTSVTEARARAATAATPADKSRAEGAFGQLLGSLFAVAESYPDLKANSGFLTLQQQLRDLEDHIQYARRYYKRSSATLNTLTESFPRTSSRGLRLRAVGGLRTRPRAIAPHLVPGSAGGCAGGAGGPQSGRRPRLRRTFDLETSSARRGLRPAVPPPGSSVGDPLSGSSGASGDRLCGGPR
jgi:LemA protein